jgi:2-polyprenyl-3-methyl-5-hydroxy-6-metoxy-1,4-benzoquinol methylase
VRTLIKTIQSEDHDFIKNEKAEIATAASLLSKHEIRCDIGHPERFWEYGYALKALRLVYPDTQPLDVLDVGAGWSPLGPALAMQPGVCVTELEPDFTCKANRYMTSLFLLGEGHQAIDWQQGTAKDLMYEIGEQKIPAHPQFHAVFCISVLEHVERSYELKMWADLAKLVKPGGLLFITCDCVPDRLPKVFDNLRVTNYMTQDLMARVGNLDSNYDMVPLLGQPDFTYHGNYVHDYSFFMAAMRKRK